MKHQPKINIIIAFFLLIYVVIIDLIGIILFFFGLDDFFLLDAISWPTRLYFKIKGVKGTYDTFATIAELLPYVGALPLKTLGVGLVILEDRRPNSKLVSLVNNSVGKLNLKNDIKKTARTPVGKK